MEDIRKELLNGVVFALAMGIMIINVKLWLF